MSNDVSVLLRAWTDGDQGALAQLTPIVYDELHRLAHHYLKRERAGHSLQTTALVNEAYVRLVDYKRMDQYQAAPLSASICRNQLNNGFELVTIWATILQVADSKRLKSATHSVSRTAVGEFPVSKPIVGTTPPQTESPAIAGPAVLGCVLPARDGSRARIRASAGADAHAARHACVARPWLTPTLDRPRGDECDTTFV